MIDPSPVRMTAWACPSCSQLFAAQRTADGDDVIHRVSNVMDIMAECITRPGDLLNVMPANLTPLVPATEVAELRAEVKRLNVECWVRDLIAAIKANGIEPIDPSPVRPAVTPSCDWCGTALFRSGDWRDRNDDTYCPDSDDEWHHPATERQPIDPSPVRPAEALTTSAPQETSQQDSGEANGIKPEPGPVETTKPEPEPCGARYDDGTDERCSLQSGHVGRHQNILAWGDAVPNPAVWAVGDLCIDGNGGTWQRMDPERWQPVSLRAHPWRYHADMVQPLRKAKIVEA